MISSISMIIFDIIYIELLQWYQLVAEYYMIHNFELCYKKFYYRDITLLYAGILFHGINVFYGNTLQIRVHHPRT